jgi:hypothetical protein
MSTCLNFEEILEVGQPQLASLTEVSNSFPDVNQPGACQAFTRQVRLLESFIVQTYAIASSIAKKADDLDEVAKIWKEMSDFCTSAISTLSLLKGKFPYCGTSELYDLSLDYKLACDKRYRGVLQEIECRTTNLPTGLFPSQS